MLDDVRRQRVAGEVGHFIAADDHGAALGAEGVHELLDRAFVVVFVVGIELQGEAAALRVMERGVPVAADAVPGRVLGDVDEFRVAGERLDHVDRPVGGIVVYDDDVVGEVGLLAQRRPDGVADGPDAVLAGNDDRGLDGEFAKSEVDGEEGAGREIGADGLEMGRDGLFHLHLDAAVLRVHIVELLLAGGAEIGLDLVIEELADVLRQPLFGQLEPQVIEAGELVVPVHPGHGLLQGVRPDQQQPAEVEVVAHRTQLAVDDGMGLDGPVLLAEMVRIEQRRARVPGQLHHPLEGVMDQPQVGRLGV